MRRALDAYDLQQSHDHVKGAGGSSKHRYKWEDVKNENSFPETELDGMRSTPSTSLEKEQEMLDIWGEDCWSNGL